MVLGYWPQEEWMQWTRTAPHTNCLCNHCNIMGGGLVICLKPMLRPGARLLQFVTRHKTTKGLQSYPASSIARSGYASALALHELPCMPNYSPIPKYFSIQASPFWSQPCAHCEQLCNHMLEPHILHVWLGASVSILTILGRSMQQSHLYWVEEQYVWAIT